MISSLKWRAIIVAIVLAVCILFLLPTIFGDNLPSWWQPSKSLGLGLDLKGGMYLTAEADLDEALKGSVARNTEDLRFTLTENNISFSNIKHDAGLDILVEFNNENDLNSAKKTISEKFGNLTIKSQLQNRLILTLAGAEISAIKSLTLKQALETIRSRIDEFGVAEVDVRPQGENMIVLQIPGSSNIERAKNIIDKKAKLEFRLVEASMTAGQALGEGVPFGTELLKGTQIDSKTREEVEISYLVEKRTILGGESLTDARVSFEGQFDKPIVAISFDKRGSRIFEQLTGENVGRQLAIVLDGQVYSAPSIKTKISGGKASITDISSLDEASELAVILRAGSLPVPVKIIEERTIGPSLGADSIKQGLTAGLVGIGIIFIFLLVYYRESGVIANIALFTNFIIILAVLVFFGANLTLPGIFGLILTLGMAIDANVLIFERIREELRANKTIKEAVHNGFAKAFATILDSNLTSLITALVLFQFGTGPIRGFAVTLSVGLLASMFTAVFFSRVIFDYVLQKRNYKRISI